MHLDPQTRSEFEAQLALLRQVRTALLQTPSDQIADPVDHAMALRGLNGDIARYEAAIGEEWCRLQDSNL